MTTLRKFAAAMMAGAMMTGPALAAETTIYGLTVCHANDKTCNLVTYPGMSQIDTVEDCIRIKNKFLSGSPNAKFYCVQKTVATWSKVESN